MKTVPVQPLDNVGSSVRGDNGDSGALTRVRWHLDDACRRLAEGQSTLALIAVQDADELLADLEDVAA